MKPWIRSTNDRVIAGVCAGLANSLNLDVGLVRVLWVIISFFTLFAGVLVYIVCAIILPQGPTPVRGGYTTTTAYENTASSGPSEGQPHAEQAGSDPYHGPVVDENNNVVGQEQHPAGGNKAAMIFGGILVIIGVIAMLEVMGFNIPYRIVFPVALMLVGAFVIIRSVKR